MASEDSTLNRRQCVLALLARCIHRECQARKLEKPTWTEMRSHGDGSVTIRVPISRYGVNLAVDERRGDFPRDYPFAATASLTRRIRGGVPRY